MNRSLCSALRGVVCLTAAASALWAVAAAAPAENAVQAAERMRLPLALLRFERGDFLRGGTLSVPAALALSAAPPTLSAEPPGGEEGTADAPAGEAPAREASGEESAESAEDSGTPAEESGAPAEEEREPPSAVVNRDNGVPAMTLRPGDPADYVRLGQVFVNNASSAPLSADDLDGGYALPDGEDGGPLVLILHTHGCEAYTMPEGEEYEASDDHRTLDESCNVLRVGDEIAAALESAGVGVVHDRTLHDHPSYSGAYNRSLATAERYLAEYPSLLYVLDVHRDAVADAGGGQYKLLSEEAPDAAQLEFVVGSDGGGLNHPRWRENLRLAAAVQERLLADYPTLLRPIVVRNSRYNQQLTPGTLLLEVGAAGNSLAEALNAARLFAQGFADVILQR